jgi:hypothetical protein
MTKAAKRPFPRAWRRQWQQTRQAAKRPFPDMSGAEAVYECAFAAQWLADSKGLIRERWSFADDLGAEWEQPGLYRHRPVALCWDDFFGGGICRICLKRPCRFPLCSAGGGDATAQYVARQAATSVACRGTRTRLFVNPSVARHQGSSRKLGTKQNETSHRAGLVKAICIQGN